MEIIGKAFNPAGGTERAVCTNIDGWISGLMVKGEDAGQAISAYLEEAGKLKSAMRREREEVWKGWQNSSPALAFYRNLSLNDDGLWGHCLHKNSGRQLGTYPESPYTMKADMIALSTEFMLVRPEMLYTRDVLCADRFNLYYGKDAVLLSSAPYERERDWEKLNKAFLGAFCALCGDNPEAHWDDAGKVLRDTLGEDHAYVLIVDADECRKRVNWNTPEGPATDIRLKISWRKKGWALMDNEWDEHTEETVLAKTGALNYAGFVGLCITEISDSSITFRNGGDQWVLEPGKTLFYHYNDSYEDHEGVEHRDIDYSLSITWLE